MSSTVGSITAIKPQSEPDGGHMIKVADFGGEPFEVWIRPEQVAELIKVLQESVINRAMEAAGKAHFPILTTESFGLGHQARETALLVSTPEMG